MVAVSLTLLAGGSYVVSALAIYKDFTQEASEVAEGAQKAPAPVVAAPVDSASLPPHGWAIVPAKSKVQFKTTLYGAEFTTDINDISGDIIFNPDDLSTANAKVRVGTKGLQSGDAERDASMKGSDWLDSENYPDIWFVSEKFEKGEGDHYMAVGTLSVKGKTMPLIMPFTLDLDGDKAHMTATVELSRLDFGIGAGSWEDEQTVGHAVKVLIDLSVIQ
jgi:cytochrome b561